MERVAIQQYVDPAEISGDAREYEYHEIPNMDSDCNPHHIPIVRLI